MINECLILVDNSNVFIEGRKFAARQKGLTKQPTDERDPVDWSWRIDFGSLLTQIANGHKIIKGYRTDLPKWRERERAKPVPFLVS